jgi:hypothetical protein
MTTRSDDQAARQFMTADELASRYSGKVSVKTLANWRSTGTGPAYTKIGNRVFYAHSDVLKWEQQRQITPRVSK